MTLILGALVIVLAERFLIDQESNEDILGSAFLSTFLFTPVSGIVVNKIINAKL